MKIITVFYLLNATLLLLHEIESAYEREWEILKLPGRITGFIIMHVPIILVLFYGLLEIDKQTLIGCYIGIFAGIGGLIPFAVHRIFVKRKDHFNIFISDFLIYSNIITGTATLILSVYCLGLK